MDRSRPFIEVSVEGRSVADAFYSRLVSATIHDQPGQDADTCELEFDDAATAIAVPAMGAKIAVRFGFRNAGAWKMGVFVFERADYRFGSQGEFLVLSCRSADMRSDLKEPLSEHFDDTTIGAVVHELAARHGYEAKVSPELSSIALGYVARTEQSTADFLTRLADRSAAQFSVKGGKFLFLKRGVLPAVTIDKRDCESGDFSIEPRPRYAKVEAGWYDRGRNHILYETSETGLEGPVKRLRTVFAGAAEARQAALAEGNRLGRATGSGSITLAGRPEIMADQPVLITGMRQEANGLWRAASVEHRYDRSYMTTIELEAPEEGRAP
ncbi:phage late control D family protein [Mesorhizobium xinjiangense]|uniref:phage late control D family protein n=1 Tax=Mesorhizobium xinjiangense TaxID=2678685 RepID=UPI0012ED87C1|nr:late control protein [Mesorhizobium xinjiangense]